MEWLNTALHQYGWILGGSIAGLIYRLTREPLTWRETVQAVGALALTIPLARELIVTMGVADRPNTQVIIAATLAVFSRRAVGWLESTFLDRVLGEEKSGGTRL